MDKNLIDSADYGKVVVAYQVSPEGGFDPNYETIGSIGYFVRKNRAGILLASEAICFDKKRPQWDVIKTFQPRSIRHIEVLKLGEQDSDVVAAPIPIGERFREQEDEAKFLKQLEALDSNILEVSYRDDKASYVGVKYRRYARAYTKKAVGRAKIIDRYYLSLEERFSYFNDIEQPTAPNSARVVAIPHIFQVQRLVYAETRSSGVRYLYDKGKREFCRVGPTL